MLDHREAYKDGIGSVTGGPWCDNSDKDMFRMKLHRLS
jgi:hypothetical protein